MRTAPARPDGPRRSRLLGLSRPSCSRLRRPSPAADPVVLRVGTDPEPALAEPVPDRATSSATRPSSSTTTCWSTSVRTSSRSPGFADTWSASADGKSWKFHIPTGMKWSDGQPATAEDAAWQLQAATRRQKNDGNVGIGYLDPSLKNAAVTAVKCPDPRR